MNPLPDLLFASISVADGTLEASSTLDMHGIVKHPLSLLQGLALGSLLKPQSINNVHQSVTSKSSLGCGTVLLQNPADMHLVEENQVQLIACN